MTYLAREQSIEDGRPVYLYEFTLGSIVWRYAAASADVTAAGHKWRAVQIGHDRISLTGNVDADDVTITTTSQLGPVLVHLDVPPSTQIKVKIRETHYGDTEVPTIYVGYINQITWTRNPGEALITCETLDASMARDGARLTWQRSCPYALYDPLTCRVDKSLWVVPMRILAVDGRQITVDTIDGKPDGWFDGGFFEWDDQLIGKNSRLIESQAGTTMIIFGVQGGMYPGIQIKAYPGCPRNVAGCNKFNNRLNYGGFDAMPTRSPFDGNRLF